VKWWYQNAVLDQKKIDPRHFGMAENFDLIEKGSKSGSMRGMLLLSVGWIGEQ
jgi:hypothetical protein